VSLRQRAISLTRDRPSYALVVDPTANMRVMVSGLLEGLGMTQRAGVGNVAEAVEHLFNNDTSLIICEADLGDVPGVDFVNAIRWAADSPARQVPVLMIAAELEREDVAAARDNGVNELLLKPVTGQSLQARIRHIFDKVRPFIESRTFVGPCRRRRDRPFQGKDRRGLTPGGLPNFTQTVDAMLGITTADWMYHDDAELENVGHALARALGEAEVGRVSINAVTPGDRATEDIRTRGGAVAVAAGTVMDERMIERLRDLVAGGMVAEHLPVSRQPIAA